MNTNIVETRITLKNGKKSVIEEAFYEFCPEIWDNIKSFAIWDKETLEKRIQEKQQERLTKKLRLYGGWDFEITDLLTTTYWCADYTYVKQITPTLKKNGFTGGKLGLYMNNFYKSAHNCRSEKMKKAFREVFRQAFARMRCGLSEYEYPDVKEQIVIRDLSDIHEFELILRYLNVLENKEDDEYFVELDFDRD